ncbi:MAG: hypothetical protein V1735_04140 [Nanoarchaeota archaeon]
MSAETDARKQTLEQVVLRDGNLVVKRTGKPLDGKPEFVGLTTVSFDFQVPLGGQLPE